MPQPTERGRINRLLLGQQSKAPSNAAPKPKRAGPNESDAFLEDLIGGLADGGKEDAERVRQQNLQRKAKLAAAGNLPAAGKTAAVQATKAAIAELAAVANATPAVAPAPAAHAQAADVAMEDAPQVDAPAADAAPSADAPAPASAKKNRVTFAAEAEKAAANEESAWTQACEAQGASQARAAAAATEEARVEAASAAAASNDLPLDADGMLPFYLVDVTEEIFARGTVFLFGKVPVQRTYVSCCVRVTNLQRCVFVIPRAGMLDTPEVAAAHAVHEACIGGGDEAATKAAKRELNMALHQASGALKTELREALSKIGVAEHKLKFVRRTYCLDRADIPVGEQWVVKLTYGANKAPLPSDLSSEHIAAALGTHTTALENLLVKRKVMGPSWLMLKNAQKNNGAPISWCSLEVTLGDKKDVCLEASGSNRQAPPLVVASISLRTVVNRSSNINEIAVASIITAPSVRCHAPTQQAEWNTLSYLQQVTLVRRLDGMAFPHGFDKKVQEQNSRGMGRVLEQCGSERALLCIMLAKLQKMDPDVIVGHNIAGFDLEVLMHRMQACKAPQWHRVGRLRRGTFPKLGAPGQSGFGSGPSPMLLSCVSGRLLCDTYLGAKELLNSEVSYSLKALAENKLGESKIDMPPSDVQRSFDTAEGLVRLAESGVKDSWLSLAMMFYLNQLPLTRQQTALCGNVWSKTLSGQRAQRIEYLLLHEFHMRKHLVPDRLPKAERERVAKAAGMKKAGLDEDDLGFGPPDDVEADGGPSKANKGRKRGKPQYAGGLVLEPKKGLYDNFVIMMDFNSLYPSIIQEYNIDFTTVPLAKAAEEAAAAEAGVAPAPPPLPNPDLAQGILPSTIRKLVQRRREVKNLMKKERNRGMWEQLNIRQLALKITANSMYGCLGFANSRFYAKPLAMMVTSQGREILQSTADLVQVKLGLDVVYGDTDSIFVNTGKSELSEAEALGNQIKKESNDRFRLLELEIDAVYKTILLIKKKKYAGLKIEKSEGGYTTKTEMKGLDIVRRDWCTLAKDAGKYVLREVLSGKPREEVLEAVHAHLEDVKEKIDSGSVPLGKYIITKALTKDPTQYPDAKNQAHVQVAVRRRAQGRREGTSAGDTVPYVICTAESIAKQNGSEEQQGAAAKGTGGLAERARHFEEVNKSKGELEVDLAWYKANQVHPVVSRLVAVIEGTDAARVAHCLGLDSSKYHSAASAAARADDAPEALLMDDDAVYEACDRLELQPSPTAAAAPFPGAKAVALGAGASADERAAVDKALGDAAPGKAISAVALANQATLAARRVVREYYDGWLRADDDEARYRTRNVCCRAESGALPGTLPSVTGAAATVAAGADAPRVGREMTEASVFKQLRAWERALDVERALDALPVEMRAEGATNLAPRKAALQAGSRVVGSMLDRSAFKWVSLSGLFPAICVQ